MYFTTSALAFVACILSTTPSSAFTPSQNVAATAVAMAPAQPAAAVAQLPVNLGIAGNFAILSKTGISTTGVTAIVGDIGVSPISSIGFTGFGPTLSPGGKYSTSALVRGHLYAPDYAPPTPVYMTTAITDMERAYTDAAGRTLPNFTELGAGNIGGMTLAPGLYKWGTGVLIPSNGVTLSGNSTDVWIFQIAQTLTVSSAATVTMAGSANPNNVFWQVAGQTTLGTTSVFRGNILCKTKIKMNAGASLKGRALAQTAVTLIANTVWESSRHPNPNYHP